MVKKESMMALALIIFALNPMKAFRKLYFCIVCHLTFIYSKGVSMMHLTVPALTAPRMVLYSIPIVNGILLVRY